MARTVKLPAERQDEIVEAAQRLFWSRGYENTPVQAIIDEVGIAKGTFYHHYPSKDALLEALVERMTKQAQQIAEPIVADPTLGAIEKFNRCFATVGAWKTQRRELILEMHRAMHDEANQLMVMRLQRGATYAMTGQFTRIIEQGVAEGVFDTRYPQHAARSILELGVVLGRQLGESLLGMGPPLSELVPELDAFHDSVERLLGAPKGVLLLYDRRMIEFWQSDEQRSPR